MEDPNGFGGGRTAQSCNTNHTWRAKLNAQLSTTNDVKMYCANVFPERPFGYGYKFTIEKNVKST